jgi:hypothetical protein
VWISLVVILEELNALELWGVDVGNVYLETLTKEKYIQLVVQSSET